MRDFVRPSVCLCWKGGWVWLGVCCPCPPVRNDILTPRHLVIRVVFAPATPSWSATTFKSVSLSPESRQNILHTRRCQTTIAVSLAFAARKNFDENQNNNNVRLPPYPSPNTIPRNFRNEVKREFRLLRFNRRRGECFGR